MNYTIKTTNKTTKFSLLKIFLLNFILVVLEIIGLFLSIKRHGVSVFVFYTELSNYFSLATSLFVCALSIYSLTKGLPLPKIAYYLRFASTTFVTLTFTVSFFILVPLKPSILPFMLYQGSSLYHHLLCPVISFFGYFAFEKNPFITGKTARNATLFTFLYGYFISIFNAFKLIDGPYPFFSFYRYPLSFCLSLILGIFLLSFFIFYLFYKLNYYLLKKGR